MNKFMKQLQNNFTTPEQSKRLLELGLPADSGDCYYSDEYDEQVHSRIGYSLRNDFFDFDKDAIPCWSVGRLIEILSKCMPSEIYTPKFRCDTNLMKEVLDAIELELKYGLDFSKLED